MASGWRKLLEEESEHQWLAIGLFFVFVIIGGFLIGGTSSLEGMVLGTDPSHDLVFEEGEFLIDVEYHQDADWSESHSGILKTQDGLKMYQQMGSNDVDDILPENDPAIENVTLFSADSEGTVTFSTSLNTLSTYVDGMVFDQILSDTFGSEFGIHGIAVDSTSLLSNRLLITSEDGGSGLRGLNGQGIITTSAPLQDFVVWDKVVCLEDSTFLVAGTFAIQTSSSQSPASPSPQIVLAHVYWDGDSTAPQIVRQMMGNGSEIHSIHATKDGDAVVSTNEEFYVISKDSVQVLPYASTTMVYESGHDRVWLFGERGSESILRIDLASGETSSKKLGFPLSLSPTSGVIAGDSLYLHGFDSQGQATRLSLDLTLEGSLSSGRGFLNFAFIFLGVIMIATQGYLMVEKAMHTRKA
ncbi:MAG: Uncharacterised protein [Candidatus Poseidoniaceae archaeon]|nr:MAG: Uncharacterised protein [Candidatus Poseidoniaceae archaeon]